MEGSKLNEKTFVLWAKVSPYKSIICHLLDTGATAIKILEISNRSVLTLLQRCTHLSYKDTVKLAAYLIALHDIGKAHPYFQYKDEVFNLLPKELQDYLQTEGQYLIPHPGFRHEKYSKIVLRRLWTKKRNFSSEFIDEVTAVIADHHQKPGKPESIPAAFNEEYEKMQDVIEDIIYQIIEPPTRKFKCKDWSVFCELINALTLFSDWFASDERFHTQALTSCDINGYKKYYEEALECADKRLRSIGLVHVKTKTIRSMLSFFGWKKGSMRPMQSLTSNVSKEAPMFAIIEDSPGAGKTEVALFLALILMQKYGKDGIYFALPTAATSNQMWMRLNEYLQKLGIEDIRLNHGMAWSVPEANTFPKVSLNNPLLNTDSVGPEWLLPSRRALLSNFSVGTVDQIMMAVLNVRFRPLRMLGLTNKVIVIDEVHAYDAYMSTILDTLLQWCSAMNIPVILLSATLPNQKKRDYLSAYLGEEYTGPLSQNYPLITYVTKDKQVHEESCAPYKKSEYEIKLLPGALNDMEKTAETAISLISNGGNLCLMANTVVDAQKIYGILKDRLSSKNDISLLLYHARFTAEDRARIEKECLLRYSGNNNRPAKSILVCTQVVEQSLDVDFDILMTQICPIDLLIQRLGREWRHNIKRPSHIVKPEVYVLTGDTESSPMKKIYPKYIIEKTEEYLEKNPVIKVPETLRDAISFVYDGKDNSREYFEKIALENHQTVTAKGVVLTSPDPEEYYLMECSEALHEDSSEAVTAATRLGTASTRVILCNHDLYSDYRLGLNNRVTIASMLNSMISLPINISQEFLEQSGVFKGMYIAISDTDIYSLPNNIIAKYSEEIGATIIRE